MKEEEQINIGLPPQPIEAIWIAKDICYNSCSKRKWWYRLWAKLLLGWRIEDIKS